MTILTKSQTLDSTALILIDIQYFYFPGGDMELSEPEKAAEKAKQLLIMDGWTLNADGKKYVIIAVARKPA